MRKIQRPTVSAASTLKRNGTFESRHGLDGDVYLEAAGHRCLGLGHELDGAAGRLDEQCRLGIALDAPLLARAVDAQVVVVARRQPRPVGIEPGFGRRLHKNVVVHRHHHADDADLGRGPSSRQRRVHVVDGISQRCSRGL